ncbi:MAG: DUF896 domain-containing protein [Thermoflexaceae bacterium]|nr:DUF896 domain-containing protein [Thermoflexaceae bacterium]
MIDQKTIERINELYRKSQAEGLTKEELAEQSRLRWDYINAIKANLRSNLETIKIQQPDGTLIDVKKRHDEKYGKQNDAN